MADKFGNPSLQEALGTFVQSAREFGLSKAISDAQDQVQKIKLKGLKDTEQRQALGDVAQGLIARMTGLGANAAQVEQMRLSMAPKSLETPNEMYAAGLASGNQQTIDDAIQFQKFQGDEKIRELKAKQKAVDQQAAEDKALGKYADWATQAVLKTNEDIMRSGNNALLKKSSNKIAEMRVLLENAKLTNMGKAEINAGMASIFNQGAATVEATKNADIHTRSSLLAQFMQPFSDKVQEFEAPDLIRFYTDQMNRMEKVTNNLLQRSHESIANKLAAGALKDPAKDKSNFKQTISSITGYEPADIIYSPGKGVTFRKGAVPQMPLGDVANEAAAPTAPSSSPTMIKVKQLSSGRTGQIPADKFDPSKYEKI